MRKKMNQARIVVLVGAVALFIAFSVSCTSTTEKQAGGAPAAPVTAASLGFVAPPPPPASDVPVEDDEKTTVVFANQIPLPVIAPAKPAPQGAPAAYGQSYGWADYTKYTTGGANAAAANIYTVKTKLELLKALGSASSTPKIIYIEGMIDLCVDANGKSLTAVDFLKMAGHTNFATYEDYQKAYIAGSGAKTISSLEGVRTSSAAIQQSIIVIKVGSNTSLIGIGNNAGFKNGSIVLDSVQNVVVRNLSILDSYDYFPSWDWSDGNINSEYDNLSITNSSYVWVDHCLFSDGERSHTKYSEFQIPGVGNMKKWVTHDGLLDIVRGSQYITLSWNIFEDHDKALLFGNSDSATGDKGKLQITLHHNIFRKLGQRMPRVRFGQVHLYNNFYEDIKSYAMGVGDHSRIWSERNHFPRPILSITNYDDKDNKGYIFDVKSFNINPARTQSADLVAWNPANFYSYIADKAMNVPEIVKNGAGPGKF